MGGTGPRYKNGFIPDSELVLIEGNHKATRGTAARWEMLKADVKANEGVTLRITGGENAYRSFAGQVFARKEACRKGRCNDAAVAGTSSHGGSLNGRDSGAIDVSNWNDIGKDKFYFYCRRNGFEPGYFDWEPWHIIDWAPYTVPAAAAGGGSAPVAPEDKSEEDDMPKNTGVVYRSPQTGPESKARWIALIHNTGSGFKLEFDNGVGAGKFDGAVTTELAIAYDTPSWATVSEGTAVLIKQGLAEIPARS